MHDAPGGAMPICLETLGNMRCHLANMVWCGLFCWPRLVCYVQCTQKTAMPLGTWMPAVRWFDRHLLVRDYRRNVDGGNSAMSLAPTPLLARPLWDYRHCC